MLLLHYLAVGEHSQLMLESFQSEDIGADWDRAVEPDVGPRVAALGNHVQNAIRVSV